MAVPVAFPPPAAADSSAVREVELLVTVGEGLSGHGCRSRVSDVGVRGESDVRLLVHPGRGAGSVELLGPCEWAPPPPCWCAVSVDPAGERLVWSGPPRSCSAEALVTFVAELAGCRRERAPGVRHARLG